MNIEIAKILNNLNIVMTENEKDFLGLDEKYFNFKKLENSISFDVKMKYISSDSQGELYVFQIHDNQYLKVRCSQGELGERLYYPEDKIIRLVKND